MITPTYHLTQRQLNQIKQLMTICKRVDGSTPNIYPHLLSQRRALPASLLFYKNEQLIGFLGAFFFYDDACEIALMVLPVHRGRGVGKQLLRHILPLIKSQHLTRLIFSSPGQKSTPWFESHGFTYMHTEYHMLRTEKASVDSSLFAHLDIRKVTPEMISALCALDQACFPKEHNDNPTHFQSLLDNQKEYQLFAVYKDNEIVGKAHLRWTARSVTFSDIAIFPTMQGKGLGSALLGYCINYSLQQGKSRLLLDVEAKNEIALKIYTNFGFAVQNTTNYWSIPLDKLPGHQNQ